MQNFQNAVIERFQNINPEKDGASIKGSSDLKNEIQIITLPDKLWLFWEQFLKKHGEGDLIDPCSLKKCKETKGFKTKDKFLTKEFFKRFGHFTDTDFGVCAQHLLGETPNRRASYPKVSVGKSKILVPDNMAHRDWVERRKRKKIVLQDLMAIKPTLKIINNAGDVDNDVWKSWKVRHRFSSASWDFLTTHPSQDYFKRRLRNDAWLKRASDLAETYPEVHFMFQKFMKLKYQLSKRSGGVQMRGMDVINKALVTSSRYKYQPRVVNLAVLDVREIPKLKGCHAAANLDPLLDFLVQKLEPKFTEPNVWLIILGNKDDVKRATAFTARKLKQYDCVESVYVPSKAEMLGNVTSRTAAPNVPLLFLFKKGNHVAAEVRNYMKDKYETPILNQYYWDASKNTESKWRVEASELRMEFYLDILQSFAMPEENVLGIFAGAKFTIAAKVRYFYAF